MHTSEKACTYVHRNIYAYTVEIACVMTSSFLIGFSDVIYKPSSPFINKNILLHPHDILHDKSIKILQFILCLCSINMFAQDRYTFSFATS